MRCVECCTTYICMGKTYYRIGVRFAVLLLHTMMSQTPCLFLLQSNASSQTICRARVHAYKYDVHVRLCAREIENMCMHVPVVSCVCETLPVCYVLLKRRIVPYRTFTTTCDFTARQAQHTAPAASQQQQPTPAAVSQPATAAAQYPSRAPTTAADNISARTFSR